MKPKHSKYKNTGILFELLTRQITSETISNNSPKAVGILKKFFSNNSALLKEYQIYHALLNKKFNKEANAAVLLETLINAHDKLNKSTLRRERYNLVREIKDNYNVNEDYAGATEIKASDVISYSFKKTEPEQIYKKVDVQYNKDYAQDSHIKTTTPIDLGDDSQYGIETSSDAHLEFESDYIRNENTANKLTSFLSSHHKNDHLILSIKLPLQYINLEVGGKVKFRELLGGKAFGIDYRRIENPNFQHYYPLFMITSIKKNLDSVSIECMQLHHLSATEPDDDWFEGTLTEDTDG